MPPLPRHWRLGLLDGAASHRLRHFSSSKTIQKPGEMRASPGKSYGKYIVKYDVKSTKKSYQNPK